MELLLQILMRGEEDCRQPKRGGDEGDDKDQVDRVRHGETHAGVDDKLRAGQRIE